MKANEAPEKIILSADRDTKVIYDDWVINDLTDNIKIEYTRTDAFIEKACFYIKNMVLDMTYLDVDGKDNYNIDEFIEDFKIYMKGE